MKTILFYPAFTDPAQCTYVFPRVFWYFAPYDRYIKSLRGFAPFTDYALEVPSYIDKAAVDSEASGRIQKKVKLLAPITTKSQWKAEIEAADVVLVWQRPGVGENEVFGSIEELRSVCGPDKFHLVDEERVNTAASMMMKGALSLMDDEEEMLVDSKRKLGIFRDRIKLPVGYVFGTGPSLEEAWRYDYSDGHTIVCNSIVKNAPLVDHLKPIALVAGDPIFHAGPSTYAQAFREYLVQTMVGRDFHVFVPWRDYAIYMTYLPPELHERFIGIPMMTGDDYNLDIEKKFAILGLPNVLTLLLLPVAATYFDHVGISGCDGRPLSQDSYFWGHHKASQFGDQMDAIQLAHPGFFSISYNDYYLRHCHELERVCYQMEGMGKTVHAITGSFIPALRKRGAAEPMSPPKGEAEVPPVVLNLAPDLDRQADEPWVQAMNLGPKIQAGGHPFWLSGNLRCQERMEKSEGKDLPASIERITFNLANHSDSLFRHDKTDAKRFGKLHRRVRAEVRGAAESALLATEGRVQAYLMNGSLDHAAFLYEVVREQPRLGAYVKLHWFSSSDAWSSDFLKNWGWLLKAADEDPRLTLTCATQHQRDAIEARSGVRLGIAPQPSLLLDDEAAWRLINANQEPETEPRVYFPANGTARWRGGQAVAMAEALQAHPDQKSIRLVFQDLPHEEADTGLGVRASADVRALQEDPFSERRADWLRRCHAIVLPHLPPDYADRPAPLAIDSVYLGTPFVAQRGTAAAQMAKQFGAGVVVDDDNPKEIAKGLAALSARPRRNGSNGESSGKAYFRRNSWQRVAQDIIDRIPTPKTAPLVEAAVESEEVPVPLVGPIPRDQQARPDEVRAMLALLRSMGSSFPGEETHDAPEEAFLRLLTTGGNSLLVAQDLGGDKAKGPGPDDGGNAGAATLVQAAPDDALGCRKAVQAFLEGRSQEEGRFLLLTDPAAASQALELIDAVQPLAALIDFDDSRGRIHAALASALDERGYLVIVSERHPALRPDEEVVGWRIAALPFLSDLPWARGRILALPPNASLGYIKQLLIETGRDMSFVDEEDPSLVGREIWAESEPMKKARTLAYAEAPGKLWRREAFTVDGLDPSGLTCLREGPNQRVHRTFLPAEVKAGSPMTFSVDCAQMGRRFVMLWISDNKNRMRAGAIFDLETGHPVTTESGLGDPTISIEAASVITNMTHEGTPVYRLWMTISTYPFTETVNAQLLTRTATTGTRQHQGEPDRGVMARDMLLEAWDIPSRVR